MQETMRQPLILPTVIVPDHPQIPELSATAEKALKDHIKDLLQKQNAVLVAHYYTHGKIQDPAFVRRGQGGCPAFSSTCLF